MIQTLFLPLLSPVEDSFQSFREKLETIPSTFPQCHLSSIYPYTCHKISAIPSRSNSQVQTCLLKPALTISDCCINGISKARTVKIPEQTVLPLPCTAESMWHSAAKGKVFSRITLNFCAAKLTSLSLGHTGQSLALFWQTLCTRFCD